MNKLSFILTISTIYLANAHPVSFEDSLGINNSTTKKLYVELMQELSNNQSPWFRFIRPFTGLEVLSICKQGYQTFLTEKPTGTRIPKIIHQIWVGPRPFPFKYLQWQKSWQALGWTYKLWTDKEVEEFGLINKELYRNEKN